MAMMIKRSALAAIPASTAALAISGLLVLCAPGHAMAAAATPRSSLVTITCNPDPDNHAVDIVIHNAQSNGTGWMHGWSASATTLSGRVIKRTDRTIPFRLKAHSSIGWIQGYQPARIARCRASILWGK